MTTLAQFRSNLRLRLNDASASRWSDPELDSYLDESTQRYSKLFPREREIEFETNGIDTRYPLPGDLIDRKVSKVWFIIGGKLVEVPPVPFRARHSVRYYDLVEDAIVFAAVFPANGMIRVRYGALHDIPAVGDATVPSEDEDLVYLWAEYLAWRKIGGADASLSRWKDGGQRNDGPIIPHYVYLERQYTRLVDEKKAGGRTLTLQRADRRPRFDPLY
jgi:hypothetical protein